MILNKEKNFASAVVYVNNNAGEIKSFLEMLFVELKNNFEKFEIICVNDASTDDSVKQIKSLSEDITKGGMLTVINMSYPQGLEAAMNAGVDLAIGDFVFEFDTINMNYTKETIMEVYKTSLKGFDIVSASSKTESFSSKWFYRIFNKAANLQYSLTTEDFRILSRRAINRVHAMTAKIPYRKALYANCGLKMNVLFYTPVNNLRKSTLKEEDSRRMGMAVDSLILFTNIAYKFAIVMTVAMMIATLVGVLYTVVVYLTGEPVAGYTTTMLLLTGGFFGVFAVLAIIIKYQSLLLNLVFQKQKYIIENIEKIIK